MANILFIAECSKIVQGMRDKKVLTPDGDFYKAATIYNINKTVNNFKEFEIVLGKEILLRDIDHNWCEDYRFFLLERNYAKNTVSAYLSILKAFLNRFHKSGLSKFNGAGVRTPAEITTAVFNTVEELKKLYAIDLSSTPGKERVRDVYIVHSFLGLRIKDMFHFLTDIRIRLRNINENYFFEVKTNKTGEVVFIPVSKIVKEIIEKRNFNFGDPFSEQYYRKELKSIFAASGMDREILFHRTEGGEKIERQMLFSDLLGTHSARRSFATNAYLAGLNPLDIMKITGHKSYSAFIRYIRCENMAVALRISKHEFFKTTT